MQRTVEQCAKSEALGPSPELCQAAGMTVSESLLDRALGRGAMHGIGLVAHSASCLLRSVAEARGDLRDLSIQRDVIYGPRPEQRLDIVRMRERPGKTRVLLYLHGGGFQQLSRHSHWWFAARFARAGFTVLNADYRLAPGHPYPAAVEDAERAFALAVSYAQTQSEGVPDVTVAGESAGANLALGLAIRGEPERPRAAVLFSGLLQVSDLARFSRERAISRIARARIASIARDYAQCGVDEPPSVPCDPRLDPLLWIEDNPRLARALPPIYASAGTRDPIVSDTQRLERALAEAGAESLVEVYPGERHAFQALPFRRHAKQSWQSCLRLLEKA